MFDRAEPAEPPSTSIVDTANGDLEVITVPGFDNPPPADEFDTPELSGDPVTDYLAYSGPTNIPFIQIDNGQLIGLAVYTNTSIGTRYTYAVTDASDDSIEDSLNQIVGSIIQRYPGFTPAKTSGDSDGVLTSRSTRLVGTNDVNIEDVYVSVRTDSRYPAMKFVGFQLQMVTGARPDPLPIGSAIDTMIGPVREAAGLTNTDVTRFKVFVGWDNASAIGPDGIIYIPLHTQIIMTTDATAEQVQAQIQPLFDNNSIQEPTYVWVTPKPSDPDTADIIYGISRPDGL